MYCTAWPMDRPHDWPHLLARSLLTHIFWSVCALLIIRRNEAWRVAVAAGAQSMFSDRSEVGAGGSTATKHRRSLPVGHRCPSNNHQLRNFFCDFGIFFCYPDLDSQVQWDIFNISEAPFNDSILSDGRLPANADVGNCDEGEGAVIVTDCNIGGNPRLDKSGLWDSSGLRECELTVQDVIPWVWIDIGWGWVLFYQCNAVEKHIFLPQRDVLCQGVVPSEQ